MAGRVFKRGEIYWIAFSYRGKEYRKSAKTDKRREADKLLAFYLAQCARHEFKGFQQEDSYTLYEMLDDFIADYEQRGMRSIVGRRVHVKHLKGFFKDMPVDDITERHVDLYIKHRLKAVSRTTVNRETQTLGQAMRLAKRKKLLKDIPHIERFSERGNARKGFFEREDFDKIVAFLPDYLKDVARFAYTVGWRKGEILTLQWEDVHAQAIYLKPEVDKSKDGRVIPLIGEISAIIDRRRQERVASCPYVFHRKGAQIKDVKSAWQFARTQAGLPKALFHDSRRTVARNLDRAGVPRQVAKQIIGHKTDVMYNRYRIVNEQDIREGMLRAQQYMESRTPDAHRTLDDV